MFAPQWEISCASDSFVIAGLSLTARLDSDDVHPGVASVPNSTDTDVEC